MLIDTRMHLYGQKYTLPCPSIAHFIVRRLLVVLYCSVSVRHYNCLFCHAEPHIRFLKRVVINLFFFVWMKKTSLRQIIRTKMRLHSHFFHPLTQAQLGRHFI